MPKFLEDKLKAEYPNNPRAVMQRSLIDLAVSIRGHYESGVSGYQAAFEAKLSIGRDLYEARGLIESDKLFGQWVSEQDFGFGTTWARVLMNGAKNERQVRLLNTQVLGSGNEPNFKLLVSSAHNGVHYSSATPEWTTPAELLSRVMETLGAIDLDPCADSQKLVPAARHFTEESDGLAAEWAGRVFMNPPYGSGIGDWVSKLCGEFGAGRVTEAIALVPARVDTEWFVSFRDFPVCFVRGRLKFGGSDNSAPFPSAAVYLGKHVPKFHAAFQCLGDVWVLWQKG